MSQLAFRRPSRPCYRKELFWGLMCKCGPLIPQSNGRRSKSFKKYLNDFMIYYQFCPCVIIYLDSPEYSMLKQTVHKLEHNLYRQESTVVYRIFVLFEF